MSDKEDSFREHKDSLSELRTFELRWAEGPGRRHGCQGPKAGTSLADVRKRANAGKGGREETGVK